MDGFFGIGFGELVMIAIVALIVLGPERLPGALREVAKFIRQIRNLSKEFTDQFGDEFKALEDLNPRRLLQDAIDNIDEEERAKEETAKPAKKPTPAKATTPAKSTTPAKPVAAQKSAPKPKPATPAADKSTNAQKDEAKTDDAPAEAATGSATTAAHEAEAAPNRIAPPALTDTPASETPTNADQAASPTAALAQTNGHHPPATAVSGEVGGAVDNRAPSAPHEPTPEPPSPIADEAGATPEPRQEEIQS